MKNEVTNEAVLDIDTMVWESKKTQPYFGPWELCDRAAQSQAKQLVGSTGQAADTAGANAATEHGQLSPFFSNEMNAEHLFDPGQTNELLTAAQAGSGGASGALQGDLAQHAARTRNATGYTKSLQELARDKMKADAGASEGIAAQDVLGAKDLNQKGAAGLQGLDSMDSSQQLQAMGLQDKAIGTEQQAGQSGWLQNALAIADTASKFIKPR